MRFIDNETFFDISEANADEKVGISMGDDRSPEYASFIQLEKPELIRLRDFINEAIKQLET